MATIAKTACQEILFKLYFCDTSTGFAVFFILFLIFYKITLETFGKGRNIPLNVTSNSTLSAKDLE